MQGDGEGRVVPGPVRVVLCDDAAEMRSLLRWALQGAEEVVVTGEAADGDEAIALVTAVVPDVVVLDLQMPGPEPGPLLRAMAAAAPGVAIVTFSGFEPDLVAPDAASLVTQHVPKTTDLALVRKAILDVGRRSSQ
jgi:DNA-binding NarL/FixJ family response regulator